MICESPLKKERTASPKFGSGTSAGTGGVNSVEGRESNESGPTALSFGGLSVGKQDNGM